MQERTKEGDQRAGFSAIDWKRVCESSESAESGWGWPGVASRWAKVASFRRNLVKFPVKKASFWEKAITFQRDLATFHVKVASFRGKVATFCGNLATFWPGLASFSGKVTTFPENMASFRRNLATFFQRVASFFKKEGKFFRKEEGILGFRQPASLAGEEVTWGTWKEEGCLICFPCQLVGFEAGWKYLPGISQRIESHVWRSNQGFKPIEEGGVATAEEG